jgi:hypothetical protein
LDKPQPGSVFIHFLGFINNKALEFDDKDALENTLEVWDVRDTLWVFFVLQGYMPQLPDGFVPLWIPILIGQDGLPIPIFICWHESGQEYINYLEILTHISEILEKVGELLFEMFSSSSICGIDPFKLLTEEKIKFPFSFFNSSRTTSVSMMRTSLCWHDLLQM